MVVIEHVWKEPLDTAVGIQISVTTVEICINVSQKTETTI